MRRWSFQLLAAKSRRPRVEVRIERSDPADDEEIHLPPRTPTPMVKLDLSKVEHMINESTLAITPTVALNLLPGIRAKVALIRRARARSGSIAGISDWATLAVEEYTLALCEHKAWLLGQRTSSRPAHPGRFREFMRKKREEAMDRLVK